MFWPFNKKEELHPLIDRFRKKTADKRVLQWLDSISQDRQLQLPADVGLQIKEAMDISYTITSLIGISSEKLIHAAKINDFREINEALLKSDLILDRVTQEKSSGIDTIIEWANNYDLPELVEIDAMAYKEKGIPRDRRKLLRLRYLFIDSDFGIEEIPEGISSLPVLQAIAIPGNNIKTISSNIYDCASLQRLDLEDNNITTVEDGIHRLRNVHTIDLSGNQLSYVTPDIANMPSLRKLDISGQRARIDIMIARDNPLPETSLTALRSLYRRIDMNY